MTFVKTLISRSVLDIVHKKLGPGDIVVSKDDQSCSLIRHREDHVWIWNAKGQELLVTRTGQHAAGSGADVQVVTPVTCPDHQVTRVCVSKTGQHVCVWGTDGVTVIHMPPRAGVGGRFGGGKEELTAQCLSLDIVDEIQSVCWHPGSASECHLVVLSRSGVLTLYNVNELDDRTEVLKCQLSDSGQNKISVALGEVAVDLCFSSQIGDDRSWPLFVLLANSDVFCVDASLIVSSWNVEGPLEMKPSLENNYSDGEACSIVEVGGVLAIGTVQGVLYHGIILGGDDTSVHMYERVELEIGMVAHDDVYSSPLILTPYDSVHSQPGYLATHPAGLHNVQLPMVSVLKQAEKTDDPDLNAGSSIVEHLVCTRPTPSSPSSPVLGACVSWPPSTVLCLLSNNALTMQPLQSLQVPSSELTSLDSNEDISQSSPQADNQLLSLLMRKSTQPLIKSAASTDLTPAMTLELLTTATATLRREYVARLEVARQEMIRRAKLLSDRRLDQEKQLTKLEKEQNRARDKAESLSEKYEDVKDRGQELGLRVEHVLSKLQAQIPQLSDKELSMAREVSSLDRKVDSLEAGVKQLKEKEKYQRYQIGVEGRLGTSSIKDSRLDNIKEVLQRDSRNIANVVNIVTEMKKDLGM